MVMFFLPLTPLRNFSAPYPFLSLVTPRNVKELKNSLCLKKKKILRTLLGNKKIPSWKKELRKVPKKENDRGPEIIVSKIRKCPNYPGR